MNRWGFLFLGLIIVMGCGEAEERRPPLNEPPTSSIVPVDPDGAPVEFKEPGLGEKLTEWVDQLSQKAKSAGWHFFQKQTASFGWSIYGWIALGLLVGGGALIWLLKWPIGGGLALAGLVMIFFTSGIEVEIGFHSALVAGLIVVWVVSRITPFRLDDLIVLGGGLGLVVLNLITRDYTWAAYAALLLLAIEPALWREPRLAAAYRWGIMAPLWGVLLVTN